MTILGKEIMLRLIYDVTIQENDNTEEKDYVKVKIYTEKGQH